MIRREKKEKVEVVSFEIDTINALVTDEVREQITAILENGTTKLVIDLTGVRYIDSSGFGCLLAISRGAKNSFCSLIFCCLEPEVRKVIEMLHLHTVFHIAQTRDEALARV
ncbi:MAG: STAS domain-containing protein [Bacteroidales bacterium]|jgi:anti-anti-sigma factor|nr:STAS domain-containing protein [Bacteroidales bacterium]